MPKINREEYEVLKELDDKWKWIAKDDNYGGFIFCFREKPHKDIRKGGWSPDTTQYKCLWEYDVLFQFIQWEDEEPHNIQELISDYEYKTGTFDWATALRGAFHGESEETEVKKNKEWAFIELGKLFPSHAETHDCPDNITVTKCELLNKVYDILAQLDEPEPKNITLQDVTDKLWELPLNNRKLWLARLNDEFQEGYVVPLGLKTTDGEEQYLTYNGSYFASRRDKRLQQTFDTLEEIPEFYRDLAERAL